MKSKGFTLIELMIVIAIMMIVIAIIGILVAVAAPALNGKKGNAAPATEPAQQTTQNYKAQ